MYADLILIHTEEMENLATSTARTPSECCCISRVSSTLLRWALFLCNTSSDLAIHSHSSRKFPDEDKDNEKQKF